MTEEEAVETAAWMQCVFADINDDQAGVWRDQFLGDLYKSQDVRKAASQLRPHVAFFDPVRFTAIWNRTRLERLTPEERLKAADEALQKAREEQEKKPGRKEEKAILARKAEIEKRIAALDPDARMKLAQEALNRMPEELRHLHHAIGIQKGDPFQADSVKAYAGEILGVV